MSGVTTVVLPGLTAGVTLTCFVVAKNWDHSEVCSQGVDLATVAYWRDINGVTVRCPGVSNLAPFQIDGVTYTRRNRVQLDNMVASTAFHDLLATSCTTGVDNFAELFGDVSQAKVPNQANFNPAGDDGAVGPPRHDVHGLGPPVAGHASDSLTRRPRRRTQDVGNRWQTCRHFSHQTRHL